MMSLADRTAAKAAWNQGTPAAPLNEEKVAQNLEDVLPGTFAFNEFTVDWLVVKDLPWGARTAPYPVTDPVMRTILRGIQAFGVGTLWEKLSLPMVERAVLMSCESNSYDELKDWFKLQTWDGVPRIEELLIKQFGIEDTQRTRILTRILFMQGVIRALHSGPGCKADVMVVLQGEEGIYKSSFFRDLCPAPHMYGGDIPHPLGSKDSKDYLRKKFIIEIAEMHSYRKSEVEAQKQFLSLEADTFRAAYGHFTEMHYRRMIFTGTSNLREIIAENGRRIGILACTKACDINAIPQLRGQLWAEAMVMYQRDYVAIGRSIVTKDDEELFKAGNEPYVIQSGYADDFETWKIEVGDKWFTLKDMWKFIAKERDIVDLEREKKRLTDALHNAGFANKLKAFRHKSGYTVKGPIAADELEKLQKHLLSLKVNARLWRVKKIKELDPKGDLVEKELDLDGSVDHILDVYKGGEWLQKQLDGANPDMQPDERAKKAGIAD